MSVGITRCWLLADEKSQNSLLKTGAFTAVAWYPFGPKSCRHRHQAAGATWTQRPCFTSCVIRVVQMRRMDGGVGRGGGEEIQGPHLDGGASHRVVQHVPATQPSASGNRLHVSPWARAIRTCSRVMASPCDECGTRAFEQEKQREQQQWRAPPVRRHPLCGPCPGKATRVLTAHTRSTSVNT